MGRSGEGSREVAGGPFPCPSPWVRALLPSPPRPALTLGAPEHEPKPLTVLLLQQNCLLFDDVIAGGEGGGGARVGWVEKGS